MNQQSRFFRLARVASYKSSSKVRIGAVLTLNRKVISVGHNKMDKSHPRMASFRHWKKIHAEFDTTIGVKNDLRGSIIYVYRDQLDGKIGMCKPCPDCQVILRELGVVGAYFTDPSETEGIGFIDLR